jgi:hypothetical protein
MRKTQPIDPNVYKRAIKLCQRASGATTPEINDVIGRGISESIAALRTHLKSNYPTLMIRGESLTKEEKNRLKLRNGPHKRYFITNKAEDQRPEETDVAEVTEEKAPTSQVEPSNVAPSQVGEQGIVGVGKTEEAEGQNNQESAEEVKSPNPEEPSPQVPAASDKPAVTGMTGEEENK